MKDNARRMMSTWYMYTDLRKEEDWKTKRNTIWKSVKSVPPPRKQWWYTWNYNYRSQSIFSKMLAAIRITNRRNPVPTVSWPIVPILNDEEEKGRRSAWNTAVGSSIHGPVTPVQYYPSTSISPVPVQYQYQPSTSTSPVPAQCHPPLPPIPCLAKATIISCLVTW